MEEYIGMPPGKVWELDGDYDPTGFFRALGLFTGGSPMFLYIEGTAKYLRERFSGFMSETQDPVEPGTIWPKSPKLHLALSPELLDILVEISEGHAAPEYADHIVLYGDTVILEAYDFTCSSCQISSAIDETLVAEFARISGSKYRLATV